MIKIKVDDREVRKLLEGMVERGKNMSPVMRKISGKR